MNYLLLYAQKAKGMKLPQANDVGRIMEIIEIVGMGSNDSKKVAKKIGFDVRQSSYYRDAAEILGFLDPRNPYHLTDLGRQYLVSGQQDREKMMLAALYRFPLISIIISCLESELVKIASRQSLEDLSEKITKLDRTVVVRRTQTVLAWIDWIQRRNGILEIDKDMIRLSRQTTL